MEPHRDLIEKFLRNESTEAEAELVQQYFTQYPDAIERYLPVNDWMADGKKRLEITVSERIMHQIRETYNENKQGSVRISLLRYAVAASVMSIIIFGSIKLFTGTGERAPEKTLSVVTGLDSNQALKVVENFSAREMQATLPDGSVVTVYPNSSLKYLPAFEKNRRDLYLKGKALFQVSKDSSRPFTVYAVGIATTAIGTRFLVSELGNQKVSVALLEGSVKVWPQNAAENGKLVLLRPGDELVVSSEQFSNYSLTRSLDKDQKNAIAASKNQLAKEEARFVFKNHSLNDVFKQLEKKFSVTINYEATVGDEEKLFTGKFLKSDSLEFIIKTICGLQGLQYKMEDNVVTVSSQ